jgi:hypothetical protein
MGVRDDRRDQAAVVEPRREIAGILKLGFVV